MSCAKFTCAYCACELCLLTFAQSIDQPHCLQIYFRNICTNILLYSKSTSQERNLKNRYIPADKPLCPEFSAESRAYKVFVQSREGTSSPSNLIIILQNISRTRQKMAKLLLSKKRKADESALEETVVAGDEAATQQLVQASSEPPKKSRKTATPKVCKDVVHTLRCHVISSLSRNYLGSIRGSLRQA